jgi:hypothetical protein
VSGLELEGGVSAHAHVNRLHLAGDEPLALPAAHSVASALDRTAPLTGARSLRVMEALEAAEHGTITGGRAG